MRYGNAYLIWFHLIHSASIFINDVNETCGIDGYLSKGGRGCSLRELCSRGFRFTVTDGVVRDTALRACVNSQHRIEYLTAVGRRVCLENSDHV